MKPIFIASLAVFLFSGILPIIYAQKTRFPEMVLPDKLLS
jgi:hypothetical protein